MRHIESPYSVGWSAVGELTSIRSPNNAGAATTARGGERRMTSKCDEWKTREPDDYLPAAKKVDGAIANGDYDDDLADALRQAGSVGVEELVAKLLAFWDKRYGSRKSDALLRDLMLETPQGQALRERLIEEALEGTVYGNE